MGESGLVQIQSFRSLGFEADAIAVESEQLRNASADRRGMGADFRRCENEACVQVGDRVARIAHPLQRFPQEEY